MGRGFSSNSSLLYHRKSPSALTAIEDGRRRRPGADAHARTCRSRRATSVPRRSPGCPTPISCSVDTVLLGQRRRRSVVGQAADRQRAVPERGAATSWSSCSTVTAGCDSVFGALAVGPGDYVVIPASTTHRWLVSDDGPLGALVFAGRGHVGPPAKYLSRVGQFLEHAPYCERDIRVRRSNSSVVDTDVTDDPCRCSCATGRGLSRLVHRHHPFDVVGWDGCVYPCALNIADFEPIVGRLHQPPPVHQTFEVPGFVICSFVPRLFDFHPDAVKVPYHHANTDSDEVLFYSAGNFMSRAGSGIGVGSISYHPAGFVHGPQPGSVEAQPRSDGDRRGGGDARHVRPAPRHRCGPRRLRRALPLHLVPLTSDERHTCFSVGIPPPVATNLTENASGRSA